ncbi:unnamed protein product [Blepharisma stoltei]|uniref:Uncharacterized protein n=1 Tax=Blepharisma stoltei TaxID=1481888 RepID=A0AAU9JN39_9CILI|nr:unnamed protein product [Blepharisma stoltei]
MLIVTPIRKEICCIKAIKSKNFIYCNSKAYFFKVFLKIFKSNKKLLFLNFQVSLYYQNTRLCFKKITI